MGGKEVPGQLCDILRRQNAMCNVASTKRGRWRRQNAMCDVIQVGMWLSYFLHLCVFLFFTDQLVSFVHCLFDLSIYVLI
jgi:hypothetical protein